MVMQKISQSQLLIREQDAQFRVVQAISGDPRVAQRELSREMGVSLGRAHYCLASLIEIGWAKIDRLRASARKKQCAYNLTPRALAKKMMIAARYLGRKTAEYEAFKREIDLLRKEMGLDDRRSSSVVKSNIVE